MVVETGKFLLTHDPAERVYFFGPFNRESVRKIKLTNNGRYHVAWKCKCTDNKVVRISPPAGVLRIGEAVDVTVSTGPFSEWPEGDQSVFMMNIPITEDLLSNPRKAWEQTPQETGKIELPVTFGDEME